MGQREIMKASSKDLQKFMTEGYSLKVVEYTENMAHTVLQRENEGGGTTTISIRLHNNTPAFYLTESDKFGTVLFSGWICN